MKYSRTPDVFRAQGVMFVFLRLSEEGQRVPPTPAALLAARGGRSHRLPSAVQSMDFSSEPGPKMGCVVRGRAPATSLSYHESGSHLFVASEKDSVLRIVDCIKGGPPTDRSPMLKLQREGIRIVRATHNAHCVLFAPGTNDGVPKKNNIYYHSVHDNKILREFEGHNGVINGICMSPVDDTFLSSSIDGTVR